MERRTQHALRADAQAHACRVVALVELRAHEIGTIVREARAARDAYFMLIQDEAGEDMRLEYAARFAECQALIDRMTRLVR